MKVKLTRLTLSTDSLLIQTHVSNPAEGTLFLFVLTYSLTVEEEINRGSDCGPESRLSISNHSFVMFFGKSAAIHMSKATAEKMNSCHRLMC